MAERDPLDSVLDAQLGAPPATDPLDAVLDQQLSAPGRRQPPSVSLPMAGGGLAAPQVPEALHRQYDPMTPEALTTMGKYGLKYAGPAAVGMLLGNVAVPAAVTGAAARAVIPPTIDLLSQLAYTRFLQKMGLEEEGLDPLKSTATWTLGGHLGSKVLGNLLQRLAGRSKAGKLLASETAAQELESAAGVAKTEADDLTIGLKRATDSATKQASTQKLILDEGLEQARAKQALEKEVLRGVPGENARSASTWLNRYPAPSEEEVGHLFSKLRYQGKQVAVPLEVFDEFTEVRKTLLAEQQAIGRIAPDIQNRAVTAVGQPSQVTRQVEAAQAAAAEAERAERLGVNLGRSAGQTLKGTPDALLEVQDFLRKPGPDGRWGIRPGDDLTGEVNGLLRLKGGGQAGRRLLNQNGYSLQEVAERLQEAGFLREADTNEVIRVLDDSLSGRPQLSAFRDLVDFDTILQGAKAGATEGAQAGATQRLPTFEDLHRVLQGYGAAIRTTRAAVERQVPGAAAELVAYTKAYGALQEGLERALARGDLPQGVQETLQAANAAHKVRSTLEDVGSILQRKLAYTPGGEEQVLRIGAFMNELHKAGNQDLVKNLREIGMWEPLTEMVQAARRRVTDQAQRVKEANALVTDVSKMIHLNRQESAALLESLTEEAAPRIERLTREAAELAEQGGRVRAAGKPQSGIGGWVPGFAGGVGVGLSYGVSPAVGIPLSAGITAGHYYLQFLRTPRGQELLGRFLRLTGEDIPTPVLRALLPLSRQLSREAGRQEAPQ